jgi:hypothetical protein
VPALFHAGGALGIFPSELSPPTRYPVRLRPGGPTYRFRFRYTHRRSGWPARKPAVPGLLPLRESLAIGNVFSVPVAGCSLGLLPPRALQRSPSPSLRPASSHALRDGDKPHSRRLRVSIGLRPAFARFSVNRERRKRPFQGSCTWHILVIRASFRPGYVFASRLAEHHCPRLAILGRTPEPCLS